MRLILIAILFMMCGCSAMKLVPTETNTIQACSWNGCMAIKR